MASQTRPNYKAGVNATIFTNILQLIKGNTVRDKFNVLADSTMFKDSDANVNGGYMSIDLVTGLVDVSFIADPSPSGKFLQDNGTWQYPVGTTPPDLETVLTSGNTTGAFDILFDNSYGIDTTLGGDTLNIGATNAGVINYGNSSTTHNFLGTAIYELQTNAYVEDKLMTLNSGGAVSSGIGVGFEIEENAVITGYFKTNAARNGYSFLAPAIAYKADVNLNLLTANRAFSFPDNSGTLALYSDITSYRPPVRIVSIATSATPTINADITDQHNVTGLTVNAVYAAPTGTPVDGQKLIARITDDGTPHLLGFNAAFRFSADLLAPTVTVASKTISIGWIYNAAAGFWDCQAVGPWI